MSTAMIYQLPTPSVASVGIFPNFKFMVCGDNLASVINPGYLNQVDLQSTPISPSDIVQVLYNYTANSNSGTYGIFTVSIDKSTGLITLSAWKSSENTALLTTFFSGSPGTSTFTVPANASYISYFLVGGGGGGGGYADNGIGNTFGGASGGGSGAFAQGTWTVGYGSNMVPASSFDVTIDPIGIGGVGATNGAPGGGITLTYPNATQTFVLGGSGGIGVQGIDNTTALFAPGGGGGTGVSGVVPFQFVGRGYSGFNGFSVLGQVASGAGGNSNYSGGAAGFVNIQNSGISTSFGGAGGSGACGISAGSLNGGNGASAIVIFNVYGVGP
jgi:hypothetical protein